MLISDVDSKEIKNNTKIFESLKSRGSITASEKNDLEISFIYDSINDFTIDIRQAKKITSKNGKYHSYTFSIVSDDNSLNNLLYSLQADGTYHVFKVTYELSEDEKEKLKAGQHIDLYGKGKLTRLNNTVSLSALSAKSSVTISCVFASVSWCSYGNHAGGYDGGSPCPGYESKSESYCTTGSSGGGGGTTPPDSGEPSGGGGGGGSTGGGSTPNPDDDTCIADADGNCIGDTTTPTLDRTSINDKLITTLQLDNGTTIENWVASQPLYVVSPIYNFIKDNGFTPQAKAFGLEATNEIMQGGKVDFREAFIPTETQDDNFVFQGSKELISKSFNFIRWL